MTPSKQFLKKSKSSGAVLGFVLLPYRPLHIFYIERVIKYFEFIYKLMQKLLMGGGQNPAQHLKILTFLKNC
jgi:hypothetical protein